MWRSHVRYKLGTMELGAGCRLYDIFYYLQLLAMRNKRDSPKPKTRSPSGPPALQGPHMLQDAAGADGLVNIPVLLDLREAFDATPFLHTAPIMACPTWKPR